MRPTIKYALIITLALVAIGAWLGTARHPIPPDSLAAIDAHYRAFPIGGGWQFERAVDDGGRVRLDVIVDPAPRDVIGLRAACPNPHDLPALPAGAPIEVHGRTADRSWTGRIECLR